MFGGKVDAFHREQMQQLVDSMLRAATRSGGGSRRGGGDGRGGSVGGGAAASGANASDSGKLEEKLVSLKLALVAGLTVRAPAARLSVASANVLVNRLNFGGRHGAVPQTSAHVKVSFLLCTVTFYANLAHSLTRSP